MTYQVLVVLNLFGLVGDLNGPNEKILASRAFHVEKYIYAGSVFHRRFKTDTSPRDHKFSYDVFMMMIELNDDTDYAFDQYWLWSSNDTGDSQKPALGYLRKSEYLSREQVHEKVFQDTGKKVSGKVYLLTNWRYWGYTFNPISYYWCKDESGKLVAMLSEVTNTPWGEKCYYTHACTPLNPKRMTDKFTKIMHVSPFFKMHYDYRAKYDTPNENWNMTWLMTHETTQKLNFIASLHVQRHEVTQSNLLW
eukprot:CAMPEP_0168521172 /NCGR_PEP_ID=MMETSP0405-20121227/8494_1 /TAXON_ID=498012 /ORGANISM="Trichosphaerium sp, Strain Am-I-7 wt" /LENGTH=249 /DNA_ID=CAMNT_0008542333 /DNA_START=521 /DNA_END=1267 /DNA_ORIENTATION=-